MNKPRLIAVAGPTASGKSACAVELCRMIGGEVISCDSMQIYRGMDIGTAKPTIEEMGDIPHHMIDVADPGEKWSAARYAQMASGVIRHICSRGVRPVLCGGTGLYINALTKPMGFSMEGDEALRAQLQAVADGENGAQKLHDRLAQIDRRSAERLHVNDVRRVMRAIEIYQLTGKTMSQQMAIDAAREGDYDEIIFALDWPREVLYARIDKRVDQMMARGLADEVKGLVNSGVDGRSTAMQALGYKEIAAFLRGEVSKGKAVEAVKQGSRNYAKRQITWFKRDARVRWISAEGRTSGDIAREMLEGIQEKWTD